MALNCGGSWPDSGEAHRGCQVHKNYWTAQEGRFSGRRRHELKRETYLKGLFKLPWDLKLRLKLKLKLKPKLNLNHPEKGTLKKGISHKKGNEFNANERGGKAGSSFRQKGRRLFHK